MSPSCSSPTPLYSRGCRDLRDLHTRSQPSCNDIIFGLNRLISCSCFKGKKCSQLGFNLGRLAYCADALPVELPGPLLANVFYRLLNTDKHPSPCGLQGQQFIQAKPTPRPPNVAVLGKMCRSRFEP